MRVFPLFTHGTSCPRCGSYTTRVRTPLMLRPVKAFAEVKRRSCTGCDWHGFSFPQRVQRADEVMSSAR